MLAIFVLGASSIDISGRPLHCAARPHLGFRLDIYNQIIIHHLKSSSTSHHSQYIHIPTLHALYHYWQACLPHVSSAILERSLESR